MAGLACLLKERGVDVSVYTYFSYNFYVEQLKQSGVPYEVVKGAESHWRRFFYLRKKLLAAQPDWVVAYLDTPCIMASLVNGGQAGNSASSSVNATPPKRSPVGNG